MGSKTDIFARPVGPIKGFKYLAAPDRAFCRSAPEFGTEREE